MYLGIDFGTKRIGLALGQVLPKGLGTIANNDEAIAAIVNLARENEVNEFVLGLPIRSAGEEGTIAPQIRDFGQKLANESRLGVYLEPEQFTSFEAESQLREYGGEFEKGKVDELAAVLILEQFLQRTVNEENLTPHIKPE